MCLATSGPLGYQWPVTSATVRHCTASGGELQGGLPPWEYLRRDSKLPTRDTAAGVNHPGRVVRVRRGGLPERRNSRGDGEPCCQNRSRKILDIGDRGHISYSDPARTIDGDRHWHDLRHECGSRYADEGLDARHILRLLGHADLKTTERYLNSQTKRVAEAMKKSAGRTAWPVIQRSSSASSRPTEITQTVGLVGGPPGDRTRDTVIKSHVLYH